MIVSILLRLQRGIRRFFRRSPAVASLLFAAVTIFYLIISNGANISSLVLQQVDVWLSLLAFAIVVYCGVTLVRNGQRLRAGGAGSPAPAAGANATIICELDGAIGPSARGRTLMPRWPRGDGDSRRSSADALRRAR